MRKFITIFLICTFIFTNPFQKNTNAFVMAIPSLLYSALSFSSTAKNIAVGVTVAGAVAGYLHFRNSKESYVNTKFLGAGDEPTTITTKDSSGNIDTSETSITHSSDELILYDGNVFTNPVLVDQWTASSMNSYVKCIDGSFLYPDSGNSCVFSYLKGAYITVIHNSSWSHFQELKYSLSSEIPEIVSSTDAVYTQGVDSIEDNEEVPPFVIPGDKGLTDITDSINEQLSSAGYTGEAVTNDDVADILPFLPQYMRDTIKENSDVVDSAMIDDKINDVVDDATDKGVVTGTDAIPKTEAGNVAVEQTKPIDIAEPDVPAIPNPNWIPDAPTFSDNISTPTQLDFLKPVKDFFTNALNYFPFINMFQSATINTDSPKSIVTFPYKNNNFTYDFSQHSNIFTFMRSVILFCSSVLSVFIIVRRS